MEPDCDKLPVCHQLPSTLFIFSYHHHLLHLVLYLLYFHNLYHLFFCLHTLLNRIHHLHHLSSIFTPSLFNTTSSTYLLHLILQLSCSSTVNHPSWWRLVIGVGHSEEMLHTPTLAAHSRRRPPAAATHSWRGLSSRLSSPCRPPL